MLAVFAFPLHLGAIRIGVLVLYRDHSGMLSADEMAYGLVLADVATQVLLALQAGAPTGVAERGLGERAIALGGGPSGDGDGLCSAWRLSG